MSILFPTSIDVADTIKKRLSALAASELFHIDAINFRKVQGLLDKLPFPMAILTMKSWTNAWTTSSRMHEAELLPCLFDCPDALDTLDHYLACDRLWRLFHLLKSDQLEEFPAAALVAWAYCLFLRMP